MLKLDLPSIRSCRDYAATRRYQALHRSTSTIRHLAFDHRQIHRHSLQASHRLCLSSQHVPEPFYRTKLNQFERTATWRNMSSPERRQVGSSILALFLLPSASAKPSMASFHHLDSCLSKYCFQFAFASTARLPDACTPPPLRIDISPACV